MPNSESIFNPIDFISNFKVRLSLMQEDSGLTERKFAEKIGLPLGTYRNLLGRSKDPKYSGTKGPGLAVIGRMLSELGKDQLWYLLTGEGPETEKPSPNLDDLDRLFEAAREKAASDPDFAGWLKVELKKVIE